MQLCALLNDSVCFSSQNTIELQTLSLTEFHNPFSVYGNSYKIVQNLYRLVCINRWSHNCE